MKKREPEIGLIVCCAVTVLFIIGSMFWAIWYTANQQRSCDQLYGDQWDSWGWEACVETDMEVKK